MIEPEDELVFYSSSIANIFVVSTCKIKTSALFAVYWIAPIRKLICAS